MCDVSQQPPLKAPGLRVFRCHDWRIVRHLRLRALTTDGAVFVGGGDLEDARDEAGWRRQLRQYRWVAATVDGEGVGLARINEAHDGAHLESLWVDRRHRRTRVATRLIAELFHVGREQGITRLLTWVVEDNVSGAAFCRHLGFQETGERAQLPDGRWERRFSTRL